MNTGDGPEIRKFELLSAYSVPSLPTDETIQDYIFNLIGVLSRGEPESPLIADAQLGTAGSDRLDQIAPPPALGPVLREMTATYGDWLKGKSGTAIQVVALPPGDENGLIRSWATEQGLDILPEPDRKDLIEPGAPSLPGLEGDGALVIPDLSRWFLRHENGLTTLRALLEALHTADRRVLIGCNTWAWAFLSRALDAALILPAPYTFVPYDAERLQAWFTSLSAGVRAEAMTLRLATTGDDLFDPEAEKAHEYFVRLAGRSRGIPWVAWHMWRSAIHDLHPDEGDRDKLPDIHDDDTFWVSRTTEFQLPKSHEQETLMMAQALLIHGELPLGLLPAVLPLPGGSSVLPALIDAGFVRRHGDRVRINPAAYPALHVALGNAGFPMDGI